jgi:hypothetical protein
MKPLIICEWNGHHINSTTNTKKKKLIVKSFDVVKSLDRIIIQETQDHNSRNIS